MTSLVLSGMKGGPEETLGERVRRLRRARGMSQDALARAVGMSKGQVYQVERGPKRGGTGIPYDETLTKYAEALGVSRDYLLYGRDFHLHDGASLPPDLTDIYVGLGEQERRALLQNARTLREVQQSYAEMLRRHNEEDGGGSDVPPDEPDDQPSLHPPGTMGDIFTPAADTGEDLKRAENRRRYDEEQRRKRQAGPDDS